MTEDGFAGVSGEQTRSSAYTGEDGDSESEKDDSAYRREEDSADSDI